MRKGFTLIELLAVIVILALLATIAVPSAISISNSVKQNLLCEKVDILLTDAERWGEEHSSRLSSSCYYEVTVDYLVEQGITQRENDEKGNYIINPVTNESMDQNTIGLYIKNKRAQAFFVDSTIINECSGTRICKNGESQSEDNCIRICGSGESESNDCTVRPSNAC